MRKAVRIEPLTEEQRAELEYLYRKTDKPRVRTRAQMVLLSAEQGMKAEEIAVIVRESAVTVLTWLKLYIVAELLKALLEEHPSGTVYVAWDNASIHQNDEVEEVVRGVADRLVLLYLPTYSPWLNPIEKFCRHFRREVTHCELYEIAKALIEASYDFFKRFIKTPEKTLSIIGNIRV